MTTEAGSYNFQKFNQDEFTRLMHQGSATWQDEIRFLEWAGLKPGMTVADVGCGPGVISRLIAEYIEPDGHVYGMDVNETLLETANAIKTEATELFLASVYDLSTFHDKFDFVYVRLLFQHLSKPLAAMREILSILKPGGRACILDSDENVLSIVPAHPGLPAFIKETQEMQRSSGGDRFVGGKLAYYMKQIGFQNVEPKIFIMTPDSIGKTAFLDTVLKWRPLLFSGQQREQATIIMKKLYQFSNDHMIYGHNGSFVVRGKRENVQNAVSR